MVPLQNFSKSSTRSVKPRSKVFKGYKVNLDAIPLAINIPTDVSWNEFTQVKRLARSAAFLIFRARWRDQTVVVKRLLDEEEEPRHGAIHEINREIKVLSRIQHPHIIKVLGSGNNPNRFAILEYMGGGTLSQKLNYSHGMTHPGYGKFKLPQKEALEYATKLAEALAYMHESWNAGVRLIHRDLKPDNIAFTADGEIKIMDFGLCTLVRRALHEDVLYPLSGGVGTWKYMAPEIALNKQYNHRADVYSYTLILFHILTGRHSIPKHMNRTEHRTEVIRSNWRPVLMPTWPMQLLQLFARGWSSDIRVRPNFLEILTVLHQLSDYGLSFDEPMSGGVVDGLRTFVT